MNSMKIERLLQPYQQRISNALEHLLLQPNSVQPLHEAMRYSVHNGGKRLRPLLVYGIGEPFLDSLEDLDAPAMAVELIHCYSLIHDDLPAMDDSPLRRGKPSCHVAFDEATAILAGDSLLTLAFEVLANASLPETLRLTLIKQLTMDSGLQGMAGGQCLDLAMEKDNLDENQLLKIHHLKTGALIRSSMLLGAYGSGQANPHFIKEIKRLAEICGLAFQIQDDILDVCSNTDALGKPIGIDHRNQKTTFVTLFGLEQAMAKVQQLKSQAETILTQYYSANNMIYHLCHYLVDRAY